MYVCIFVICTCTGYWFLEDTVSRNRPADGSHLSVTLIECQAHKTRQLSFSSSLPPLLSSVLGTGTNIIILVSYLRDKTRALGFISSDDR